MTACQLQQRVPPLPEPVHWERPLPAAIQVSEEPRDPSSPLDLASLLDLALHNNPSTQKAWADLRSADFSIGSAESALYPSLNFLETLAYSDVKNTHPPPAAAATPAQTTADGTALAPTAPEANAADASGLNTSVLTPAGYSKLLVHDLSISYLLFDFGGRQANINAARQAFYKAKWQREQVLQEVVLSVLKNYYLYMGYKALVEARKSDVKNASANAELAHYQFEAGIQVKLDVLQTAASLVDTQSLLVESEGMERVAWSRLMTSLGLPATAEVKVEDFTSNLPLGEIRKSVEYLVKMAEEQRPDLAAAIAAYRSAEEEVTIARSRGLPVLTATGNISKVNFFNNPAQNLFSSQAALELNVPLFSGFYFDYQTQVAKANAQASHAEVERKRLDVIFEVAKSYQDFITAMNRMKFSEEFLDYTQEAYAFAFAAYREGVTSVLELLLAQRNLSSARAQMIEARTRWAISLVSLAFATGSL